MINQRYGSYSYILRPVLPKNDSNLLIGIGVSLVKTMKYCRDHFNATTDRPTNINSHVTAKKAERRQLNHAVEVVNEGDLSASKKAHAGDRVAAQTRPHGPRVALSTKPREEQGEEYDSDYSEVAITSDVQDSLGISIYQNVAYDLYGDDIATVDSIHQEAATFCGPVKTAIVVSGVPPRVEKNFPKVRTKPKGETSSSSGFEASVQDDHHKGTEPQHLETSIISVYDMVRSEYGGELEAQSAGKNVSPKRTYELLYCNTSYGVQESAREQYCHNYKYITREMSELGEALYSNLEDNPEHDYENLKIKPGASDSAGDKVFCGNLNEDTEENEYYNQAEILHGD